MTKQELLGLSLNEIKKEFYKMRGRNHGCSDYSDCSYCSFLQIFSYCVLNIQLTKSEYTQLLSKE